MKPFEIAIQSIQSVNVIIAVGFFVLFCKRIFKIKSMSTTCKYLDTNWKVRFVIAVLYIFISATIIAVLLVCESEQELFNSLMTSGSIGFGVNALILMMHVAVLSQQIKREIPFSSLHQNFLIFLVLISFIRLGFAVYSYATKSFSEIFEIIILSLAILLVVVSIIMVLYWFLKKKTLPSFDDFSKVDINTITQRITNPMLCDHNSLANEKISVEKWNLILPNITVELGKVHIILQMLSDDDILKSLGQESTKSSRNKDSLAHKSMRQKNKQHLQIISDRLYTFKEIKDIYLVCSRFNLQTEVVFQGSSVANFYRQVKKFVEELFTIKQAYKEQIFQLFSIDKQSINQLNFRVKRLIRTPDELYVSKFIDHNALFLSIQIFKQLFVEDHYIFYIHTVEMEQKDESVCYKRYSDFEDFNKKLQQAITNENKGQYQLPAFPKKHVFSWNNTDPQKVAERRKQLQNYCQQTFNDFYVMTKIPRARQLIFEFLGLKKAFQISPNTRKAMQFYQNLQIAKGNIYKALVGEQYVTFYQFQLYRNGILVKSIFKRFRQFIALHNSLQRWMQNSQIFYKFIVLPEKHLYKSESKRHDKLKVYLQNVIIIKQSYKIYAINKFFNLSHSFDPDNSGHGMSIIKKQGSDMSEGSINHGDRKMEKMCEISQASEKQRMSLLIQELGD